MTRKNQPNYLQAGPYRAWYEKERIKLAHGNTQVVIREVRIVDVRTAKVAAILGEHQQANEELVRDAMNAAWLLSDEAKEIETPFELLGAPYRRAILHNYSEANKS